MKILLQISGIAHLCLAIGSLVIPKLLHWQHALEKVPVLIRQMFWTYAAYILGINIFFGVISIFLVSDLLSGSALAVSVCSLITLYWLARVIIQFTYFDKSDIPDHWIYKLGEWTLSLLFLFFTCFYGYAVYFNLNL